MLVERQGLETESWIGRGIASDRKTPISNEECIVINFCPPPHINDTLRAHHPWGGNVEIAHTSRRQTLASSTLPMWERQIERLCSTCQSRAPLLMIWS